MGAIVEELRIVRVMCAYRLLLLLLFDQHSLQYTDLLGSGLNGTSHSWPQSAQTALCISLSATIFQAPLFCMVLD